MQDGSNRKSPPAPLVTTVQLAGNDWLAGAVRSADGEIFTVQYGAGCRFAVTRRQIQWLYAGAEVAPMVSFTSSDPTKISGGWTIPGVEEEEWLAGGKDALAGMDMIQHETSNLRRFEVAFIFPEDSEEGVQLWFHPHFGAHLAGFGKGTVALKFGRLSLIRRPGGPDPDKSDETIAVSPTAPSGSVKYRVFCDDVAKRLVVVRNGVQIDDWTFGKKGDEAAIVDRFGRSDQLSEICFSKGDHPLAIDEICMMPWDGRTPSEENSPAGSGSLFAPPDFRARGELSAISSKAWTFAGVETPLRAGCLLRFTDPPGESFPSDCRLFLGDAGELDAADFRLENGQLHFRTRINADSEAPVTALRSVVWRPTPASPSAASDLLTFKGGDELSGSLVSVSAHGSLRWRMAGGQEIDFQLSRIAGARFAGDSARPKQAAGALLDFRNGDRLRADLTGLDEDKMRLHHPWLGTLEIPRALAWKLCADPDFPFADGDVESDLWRFPEKNGAANAIHRVPDGYWRYFDGRYVPWRYPAPYPGGDNLTAPMPAKPERFEVSFHVDRHGKSEWFPPAFALEAPGVGLKIQVNGTQISNWETSRLIPSLPATRPFPRALLGASFDVQLFVDSAAGVAQLFANGIPLAKMHAIIPAGPAKAYNMTIAASELDNLTTTTFSELRIRPWTGLFSPPPEGHVAVGLANGDTTTGKVRYTNGKISIESNNGLLEPSSSPP